MKLVIAGGGTGGHLFPGVALAEELLSRDGGHEVLFVGTERGIEARVVPQLGHRLALVDVAGIKGLGAKGLVTNGLRVPRALFQSRRILGEFGADCVVGVGGYASGPVVLAAALGGRRTAILEQNSVPGVTNRILGRVVRRVFLSFEESRRFFPAKRCVLAGNPLRMKLRLAASQQANAAAREDVRLLVLGGSQGARAVNALVPAALALLDGKARLRVVHQTGKAERDAVEAAYRSAAIAADVRAFIDDMATAYRDADVVLGRAGATTIAELTAFGRPAVFIPFPHATDDHQTKNAAALVAAGAALSLPEAGLTPAALAAALAPLLDEKTGPDTRRTMAAASRALGRPDAARAIVDQLLAL